MSFDFDSTCVEEMFLFNDTDIFSGENVLLSSTTTESLPYYGEHLRKFREFYASIHGYITLIVCLFGITTNVVNIIVLTRKNMISPINSILTGLAVADIMVMFSFIPFSVHNYLRTGLEDRDKYSFGWGVFALFHAHFTVVNHTISIWLTVTVAIWRFMAVCYPTPTMRWRSLIRARIAIISTYTACIIFCIPVYITFTLASYEKDGETLYFVDFSEIAMMENMLLANIQFWLFGVITILVPCVALTGLCLGLIRTLYKANQRRKKLKVRSECDISRDGITKMLLAVLLLFLLTKFPSGMLALLSGILGVEFFNNVYLNFGETMDILALVNSAVNFIIYYSMSRDFRDTFGFLFLARCSKGK